MNRPAGFTLIEVVSVTALIALAFVAMTPMLIGVADANRLDAASERIADLDARARLLAASGSGAVLEQSGGRWTVHANSPDQPGDHVIAWETGEITIALMTPDREPVERIAFDRRGRSIDYLVRIEHESGLRVLNVAGLTGWVKRDNGS